jgi:hypothetical protein
MMEEFEPHIAYREKNETKEEKKKN